MGKRNEKEINVKEKGKKKRVKTEAKFKVKDKVLFRSRGNEGVKREHKGKKGTSTYFKTVIF